MAISPTDIESARTTAQTAAETLGNLTAGGFEISDVLKKKITEALDYNKDLTGQLDLKTMAYINAPSEMRAKYATPTSPDFIKTPSTQRALITQGTSNAALPMLALADIFGNRLGRIGDIVGAGTSAYQAQTARAQSAYDIARQKTQDLLTQYAAEAPTIETVEAGGRKWLITYDRNGNIISKQDLGAASSASGVGDLAAALKILGITPGETQDNRVGIENALEPDEEPLQVDLSSMWPEASIIGPAGTPVNMSKQQMQKSEKKKEYVPLSWEELFGTQ